MALVLKLKILTGKYAGRKIEVKRPKFVVGRADDCDLRPASSAVSRRHCVLFVEADRIRLLDLGAANGTFVNDERIRNECNLASGDRIKTGPLEFEVLISTAIAPAVVPLPENAPQPPAKSRQASAIAKTKTQFAGTGPAQAGSPDDEIMHWLTDAPAGEQKSIYVEVDGEAASTSNSDTERISLDGTKTIMWPESPPVASTLPESAPLSDLLNSGKPGGNRPAPNDAGSSRDAAAAAIDIFRHRNDKPRPPSPPTK